MKTVIFTRRTSPDSQTAYGDTARIEDNGTVLYECPCSTNPNPTRPSDGVEWELAYAQVAPGSYEGLFTSNPKFGLCILVNNGDKVPTTNPNENHDGEHYATEVFIHKGQNSDWRGSKACFTIPPEYHVEFFGCFEPGETIKIELIERGIV